MADNNDTSASGDDRRASEASAATTNTAKSGKRRRSSILSIARRSFVRSGGKRGASVEMLRGSHGAEFEGKAVVKRGTADGSGVLCGCFPSSDPEVLVLIKGPFLFVFKNEKSESPKYAVSLAHLKSNVKEEHLGHTTVELETALGDCEYLVTFQTDGNPEVARNFAATVTQEAAAGEAEEVRKRLGHENLLRKRRSVQYAEKVAMEKVKDQPEKPVSRDEIMAEAMPNIESVAVGQI